MSEPLKITGLDDLIARLKQLPIDVAEEVGFEIQASGQEIARLAKKDAPTDTGFIKNGISSVQINPLTVEVVSLAEYSPYVEFGTRNKRNVPPELQEFASQYMNSKRASALGAKEAIFAWCRRKGIEESAWYPIFLSIMIKGTEPHPFFFKNFLIEKPKLIERIKKIVEG